jgi:inorganic pyrophosphatase
MANLTALANHFNPADASCKVIIETPKGRRNKFAYDPNSDLFVLKGLLPEGMMFPFDFGFVPQTLGGDGDPLDVMVLMDEPAHVGCLLDVRLVGIIGAEQTEDGKTETNDRLLAVSIHSYAHEHIHDIDEVSKTLLAQLEGFFVSYNKQRGKRFKVTSLGGPKKAVRQVKEGMREFERRNEEEKQKAKKK